MPKRGPSAARTCKTEYDHFILLPFLLWLGYAAEPAVQGWFNHRLEALARTAGVASYDLYMDEQEKLAVPASLRAKRLYKAVFHRQYVLPACYDFLTLAHAWEAYPQQRGRMEAVTAYLLDPRYQPPPVGISGMPGCTAITPPGGATWRPYPSSARSPVGMPRRGPASMARAYPPKGRRGVGLARAQEYGTKFDQYVNWVNRGPLVIVQIEHIEAVNNLEAILAADGVDGFIVGPYDLSGSLGVPGEFDHPLMKDAMHRIETVGAASGNVLGIHVVEPKPDELRSRIRQGYRFVAYSLDIGCSIVRAEMG